MLHFSTLWCVSSLSVMSPFSTGSCWLIPWNPEYGFQGVASDVSIIMDITWNAYSKMELSSTFPGYQIFLAEVWFFCVEVDTKVTNIHFGMSICQDFMWTLWEEICLGENAVSLISLATSVPSPVWARLQGDLTAKDQLFKYYQSLFRKWFTRNLSIERK